MKAAEQWHYTQDGKICFVIDSDHYKAYVLDFARAVTKFAKNATRDDSRERTFTSEEYAFCGFLGHRFSEITELSIKNHNWQL